MFRRLMIFTAVIFSLAVVTVYGLTHGWIDKWQRADYAPPVSGAVAGQAYSSLRQTPAGKELEAHGYAALGYAMVLTARPAANDTIAWWKCATPGNPELCSEKPGTSAVVITGFARIKDVEAEEKTYTGFTVRHLTTWTKGGEVLVQCTIGDAKTYGLPDLLRIFRNEVRRPAATDDREEIRQVNPRKGKMPWNCARQPRHPAPPSPGTFQK